MCLRPICKCGVPATVEEKKEMLLREHIAVWDVIASCDITGSSDASIRNVQPNDIGRILARVPDIRIFANGAKAHELYRKYMEEAAAIIDWFKDMGYMGILCHNSSHSVAMRHFIRGQSPMFHFIGRYFSTTFSFIQVITGPNKKVIAIVDFFTWVNSFWLPEQAFENMAVRIIVAAVALFGFVVVASAYPHGFKNDMKNPIKITDTTTSISLRKSTCTLDQRQG